MGRLEIIRAKVSPEEQLEIERTAKSLRQWKAEGCPGEGKRGRPRLHFGMSEEALRIMMRGHTLDAPDLSVGLNRGLMLDPHTQQAWCACIQNAYSPGYFWVGVENSKDRKSVTFQSPFAEGDVMAAVEKFRPGLKYRWTSALHPPMFSPPWPIPKQYGLTSGNLHTFFGLDEEFSRMFIGSTAAPAQRCAHMGVKLLGTSGLEKDTVRMFFRNFGGTRRGWFTVNEKSLAKVAKLCSQHARLKVIG